jgi:transposase
MRIGRPKKPLEITAEDREKLSIVARRPKSAQAMAMRARIVLSCGQGMSNSEGAGKLHITGATVGKWRERFRQMGLEAYWMSRGWGRHARSRIDKLKK